MKRFREAAVSRRRFLKKTSQGSLALGALAGWSAAPRSVLAAAKKRAAYPQGRAEHCIFIWLGGGAAQIDTWDPKALGDPAARKTGSAYPAIHTAIPGVQVCEHLSHCAGLLDRFALIRTVHHDIIDEHAAATNYVHTGRPTTGTITYPAIGSIVAHQRGRAADNIPAYVVMGYPSIMRGPGFLGPKDGYIYLTDTEKGPSGLTRPEYISTSRQSERERLLETLRSTYRERHEHDRTIAAYDTALEEAFSLSDGDFKSAFELGAEPAEGRERYGGEFGQRCLLARRLVQRGVRFIEVSFNLNFINGTGWDTHNDGQRNQHILIRQLDQALSALVLDLEKHRLLDRTLIVVASEFGRPAAFDAGGGRGHWSKAFTVALAGGALKTGQVVGETDELGEKILSRPVSVPDLHATIHCALGINPGRNLYAGDRPVPITDMGDPVRELFG